MGSSELLILKYSLMLNGMSYRTHGIGLMLLSLVLVAVHVMILLEDNHGDTALYQVETLDSISHVGIHLGIGRTQMLS